MTDMPPLSAGEELAPGVENDHVLALQQRLAEYGYFTDSVDGVFGESTEAAVREFQRNYGLTEDGVVGTEMWDALSRETESYAEPEAEAEAEQSATHEVGALSEDGSWMWDGEQWVPAQSGQDSDDVGTPAEGTLSEDGAWRWDGQEWQPNDQAESESEGELTPEQFQEVIAQSMTVHASGMA
ncbi:peptidoglycan-binding domain-containing protein [Actinokineospora sp. HUAS TT18]|uniref:peptidoglycan-binding domain-containing protein n=1 Tax=Actinokineospora sp. HUAS TT18 TaxID=3447451 RepID=UPI003F51C14D